MDEIGDEIRALAATTARTQSQLNDASGRLRVGCAQLTWDAPSALHARDVMDEFASRLDACVSATHELHGLLLDHARSAEEAACQLEAAAHTLNPFEQLPKALSHLSVAGAFVSRG